MEELSSAEEAPLAPHTINVPATPGRLFWSFFVIGAFTFGGGYAMLPLIQKSVVNKSGWLSNEEFIDAIAVAQCSPGPIAANIAVLTGYRLNGYPGALASVLGAVLPSFLTLLTIATFFLGVQDNSIVRGALTGMRPAIIALMVSSVYEVCKSTVKSRVPALIAAAAFITLVALRLHPVGVILGAAAVGLALGKPHPSGRCLDLSSSAQSENATKGSDSK